MPQGLSRGTGVRIISGRYAGRTGRVEANVFQRTVDFPEEYAAGYHVVLDGREVMTVRVEQVESAN